ncbi:MAG: phosphomannomutase [Deltaproteobacteria bacterium CG_4_9_14_3_um_filter_51_14]|nr:MAG: phosphomannomutase [Desulfobacteraceae bacterium CG2_30_51_40]PJB38345.1 MAG: phosphomannomutase [Deltaproteobacteria bacterium CG_4_9_14_3_um_filter_51_14]
MKDHIFREYDIRGVVPEDLNDVTSLRLGRAIGTYLVSKGAARISLGRDCRLSSPGLASSLTEGLLGAGIDVCDIGVVPTPLLYYSIHTLDVLGGIQVTGSHNPPEYNGFKLCLGTASIYGKEIQKIKDIFESGRFYEQSGSLTKASVTASYIDELLRRTSMGKRKISAVIDAGNGVGGQVALKAYRDLGCDITGLFCDPDGSFPNHHPDPTIPENLHSLRQEVVKRSADLGIAFDGDADRIGVIDEKGEIIWGDQLMIIFSRSLLARHPGATIIGEVKCSQALYDDIEKNGGRAIMWKAGHSLIKAKMKEEKALLAGEMSGHIFFAERYFGFDDAVYAGARLLEILSSTDRPVSALLAGVPRMINTPEIRMDCPEEKKFKVVKELVEDFKRDYKVIDVDGARVIMDGGWGLVRASNTQPVLVLRFEAANQDRLAQIRDLIMGRVVEKMA